MSGGRTAAESSAEAMLELHRQATLVEPYLPAPAYNTLIVAVYDAMNSAAEHPTSDGGERE